MRAAKNKVAVQLEKTHEDEIGKIGLRFDPMYNPTQHARTFGTVVGDCVGFQEEFNIPSDFFQEGDKVYFHYDSVDSGSIKIGNGIFLIPITDIFVRVRDGEVTPRSGIALCDPYYPNDVKPVDIDGREVMCRVGFGDIVISTDIKPDPNLAVIRSIGDSFESQTPHGLKPGDKVFREASTNHWYEIEGKNMFVVRSEFIAGKYE